ncbi:hypothetical protein IKE83_02800, partial [Candidatus Saccharibacteria bacterium]|nr:hypothetical protein [Candidatus Saccharibacteria bacterium]
MSSVDELRESDRAALGSNQIIAKVVGKTVKKGGKWKKFGAAGFVVVMILVFLAFFGTGNLIPAAVSDRLVEETDVQYADAVASKMIAIQQALKEGNLPANTVKRLSGEGVLVGEVANDGGFVENGSGNSLFVNGRVVTADDFINTVQSNATLYRAINNATYSRAAYYYDDAATAVFRKIGTTRNNYTADSDFDEVMSGLVGEGNNVSINNVELIKIEDGWDYGLTGDDARADAAANFVEQVREKTAGGSRVGAALNAADVLNVADITAKEQKSSLLFLAFMENISKMKAGQGSESKIHEAMNYLYGNTTGEVVDTKTGEVVKVSGSMVESPSLYAVLSGEKVKVADAENYASDRVLKTVENKVGEKAGTGTLLGTISSTASKIRSAIGRFLGWDRTTAEAEDLEAVTPTIRSSLVDNEFSTINGVVGGEMLVEGAVNVGRLLALQSGATPGSAESVKEYARLTTAVLAMDAEVDRGERSPFDVTSKNTFLGSIFYKLAVIPKKTNETGIFSGMLGGVLGGMRNLAVVSVNSLREILPMAMADDETERYLENFGDCRTLGAVGAVGSAGCGTIVTFDSSTLNNPYGDAGFVEFVERNTTLSNGTRTINKDSALANFIKYNNERITPMGVTDGGILSSLVGGNSSIPFISDLLTMIKIWIGATEENKRIASGAAFVNSAENADWQEYKYAQRYVSLARATAALRQYDG